MQKSARMPAVFFGHGSPMNAVLDTPYSAAWRKIGATVPKPKAILMVSAHWTTRGTAVTAMETPRTIHDFGGFPQALFDVQYPAPGSPALAARVRDLLAPVAVGLDQHWGLDHGTWSVLVHAFPAADVPVVQLSIDATQPPQAHYALGKRLAPLRDEGVLIAASGNVVHNLATVNWAPNAAPFDWAVRFNDRVRDLLRRRDHVPLIAYLDMGDDARLAAPTPEHYLPLLYLIALHQAEEPIDFVIDGIELGSISMLSLVIG
jgi:4,5-DOPA dioxygenase extradiol